MMVKSIFNSMATLFWVMVLLLVILFFFAIYFVQVSTDYRASHNADDEASQELKEMFGSVFLGMFVLFQSMTGGINWGVVARVLTQIHWHYSLLVSFFICFTMLAVLNIVTGVFVDSAIQKAQSEREELIDRVQTDERKRDELRKELGNLFERMKFDDDDHLDIVEFEQMMNDSEARALMSLCEIKFSRPWDLFRLLDKDKLHKIHKDAFVNGCLELGGLSNSVTMATLFNEVQGFTAYWERFQVTVGKQLEEITLLLKQPTSLGADKNASTWDFLVCV